MVIDIISPDVGKRLFDVVDKTRYVRSEEELYVWFFCDGCRNDYTFGERVVDFMGAPCCPSRKGNYECDGSVESLIQVRDEKHLTDLRKKSKPRWPF